MLIIHHLNNSRSQRIIWLCEEIGAPYEVRHYTRDLVTQSAPPEMKAMHPLGKSPMISDRGRVIVESSAIAELILERYGNGKLQPIADGVEHERYVQWMHYAEGSGVFPFLMRIYLRHNGAQGGGALDGMIEHHIALHLGYIDQTLAQHAHLCGEDFTAADVQNCFVAELAEASTSLRPYPNLLRWLSEMRERPAFKRAIEVGGPYAFNFFGDREQADA